MDRLSTDLGSAALGDYGTRLKRRWWVVVLGVVLGVLAGVALLVVTPKMYTATTAVLVTPTGPGATPTASTATTKLTSDINLDTENQIVQSTQVGDVARALLHTSTSTADLLGAVNVTVPPNTQVLSIDFTASTAKDAQQGSHAFAQAYLNDRADTAKRQLSATVASLQTQLDNAQVSLKAITDRAATLVAGSADRANADAQRTVVTDQINNLSAQLAPLKAAATTPGSIITDAPLPDSASAPVPAIDLGGGLVLGLLLGLAAAVGLDRRDRRLRTGTDLTRLVGLPLLGDVKSTPAGSGLPGDNQSPLFDRLRNAVIPPGSAPTVVQVADPSERGATAVVALQLARSLVRSANGAVLVLAHPGSSAARLTATEGRPGLAEVLRGEVSLAKALCTVPSLPGVSVLPPGRDPEQLESLLQSSALEGVLHELAARASVVIETRSTAESAAAQAITPLTATVVLVAERGRTDSRAVTAAAGAVSQVAGTVAGVVLVPAKSRRESAPQAPGVPTSGQPTATASTSASTAGRRPAAVLDESTSS